VLGVPLGVPRLEEAVAAALGPDGAVVRDAELRSVHTFRGPVGRHCYEVRGTVLRTR
jgi:hypothetical protein